MSKYKLFQGDCLKIMTDIQDKSIDMILCDLPYGVTQNSDDKPLPFDKLWKHYERIIKDNGCIALFGQGTFYVDLANSNRKLFRYDLIWDKQLVTGFLNANRMPLRKHEYIAIFYKKLPTYNPQFTEGNHFTAKARRTKKKQLKIIIMANSRQPMTIVKVVHKNIHQVFFLLQNHTQA